MEPIEYLRGIRRRWRVVVAAVLIAASAAWLTTAAGPMGAVVGGSRFQASILLLDARGVEFGTDSRGAGGVSLDTIAALVTLEEVAKRASDELHSSQDPQQLAVDVSASANTETGILTITATAPTAGRSERVAAAFATALRGYLKHQEAQSLRLQIRAFQRQINALPTSSTRGADSSLKFNLQSQISSLQAKLATPIGLTILQRTSASEIRSTGLVAPPSRLARVVIGMIVGLLGGLGLALVLERFDRRITTWRSAEQILPYPLLAEIPRLRRRTVAVIDRPTSRGADAFRLLASSVLHAVEQARSVHTEGNGHGTIPETPMLAITSAVRAEGKSMVSANLAAALGELGVKVIVMSTDLRSPTIHRYFDVPAVPGLVDAMRPWEGQAGFRATLRSTKAPGVSVIPGGSSIARPAALLASEDVQKFIRYARAECDILILDTPAILLSGDAAPLVQRADAVLLVARVGRTSIDATDRVSETLERIGATVVGFTLNGSTGVGTGWRSSPYQISRDLPAIELGSSPSAGKDRIGSGSKR